MQNGNLHLPKKFGLYQRAVDLYLVRWIKDAQWKFTFTEEVWIIPTRGGFVPRDMNKRCAIGNLHLPKKFGLYQRAVDLYLGRWIKDAEWKFTFTEEVWIIPTRGGFVPMKMNKRCRMEIYTYRRSLDYTRRAVDLYLGRWIREAQWKFTFTEEVWIIPTRGGFVPREMNKRCSMEIYVYRRSLDYTNARWICIYEDE